MGTTVAGEHRGIDIGDVGLTRGKELGVSDLRDHARPAFHQLPYRDIDVVTTVTGELRGIDIGDVGLTRGKGTGVSDLHDHARPAFHPLRYTHLTWPPTLPVNTLGAVAEM